MFDMGKWLIRLLKTKAVYVQLKKYVENEEALAVHKQSIYTLQFTDKEEPAIVWEGEIVEEFRASAHSDLNDAFEHFASLMIVTAATYVENMFSEFFYELFVVHPKRMHDYIVDEDAKAQKGYVKLVEILEEKDISALMSRLSQRASKLASNGSAKKVIRRIIELSSRQIDASIVDRVQEIMDKRNEIVHEGKRLQIDKIDIDATYDTLHALLKELGLACKSGGLPYEDPAHIIDLRPEITYVDWDEFQDSDT
ncbi:MAG: hypothetical protein IAE81_22470 [Caldilineaceae bacterium]|nr:hypothetical protein [Caldilineaceae bacterium]